MRSIRSVWIKHFEAPEAPRSLQNETQSRPERLEGEDMNIRMNLRMWESFVETNLFQNRIAKHR